MNYFGNSFGPQYGAGRPQNNYGMQAPQRCEVIRVNGRNGADAFRMAPNSSILLLDENEPLVWLKTTDGAGYATVAPYRIAPYQQPAPVDLNALDARIRRLEEKLDGKSDDANAERKPE